MIDILLRFPSREAAAQIGMALGYTTQDPETGDYQTTQATLDLAVCVIGEHFAPNGETTEGPNGQPVPVIVGGGQYWVMVRSLVDMELPPQIMPYVVERNPDDLTIPNQTWA